MTKRSPTIAKAIETLSPDKARLLELLLEQRSRRSPAIVARAREFGAGGTARFPASWSQQRLWFIDQLEGGSSAYNMPLTLRLRGDLDVQALQTALDLLVTRHEVLRTVFVGAAGESFQDVRPEGRFALMNVHFSATGEELHAQVQRHQIEEATASFDLRTGPLLRGRLLRVRADEHFLLLTLHHIVADGWSLGIMLYEIAELYSSQKECRGAALTPLTVQYADYSQWQRGPAQEQAMERQLEYWRERLEGAEPSLELPLDRPRPDKSRYCGRTVPVAIDGSLSSALNAMARRHGMTLFMLLYAAWAILLARLSAQEDIVVGTPVANRQRPEIENLIGFFANTLALRVSVSRSASPTEFLERVKTLTLDAYDHQDVPFERLVEAVKPPRSLNRHPIFQTMIVLQNAPDSEMRFAGLEATIEAEMIQTAKFDLLLSVAERAGAITGVVNYDTDLFDEQTVRRWIASYSVVLRALVSGDHARLGDLPILPAEQRKEIIERFAGTRVAYRREMLIHELFEEQVRRSPATAAVAHGVTTLTYEQLDTEANGLARLLKRNRVGGGDLVGICVERSVDMVVGLLGILKAGAAYLPLDPSYPRDRLEYMLQDGTPRVVLTQRALRPLLVRTGVELIDMETALAAVGAGDAADFERTDGGGEAAQLVYVIYTSGSTGKPKGTAMTHASMMNLIEWHRREMPLREGERVLQFAALSFDVAFQEVFSTLCGGGTLVMLDEFVRRDVRALRQLLERESIERLFVPPLMLQSLAELSRGASAVPHALKDIIAAGEQLRISPEIVDFFGRAKTCRLHNHYGPTETHVVTALTLEGKPEGWPVLPTIGRPIANTQIRILDVDRRLLPIGVVGDIYIAGANVAQGYVNRPELTAERFIRDPLGSDSRARAYKVGDLGRWRADGTIEYLGRSDDQVKIRGFRVELGEIEAQLMLDPRVKEAAVIARDARSGIKRLVAYVTPRDNQVIDIDGLRGHLKNKLPEFMIPGAFVVLASLPLTPSGKLDRRALPVPDHAAYAHAQYEPPVGDREKKLAEIWQNLLGTQAVGRNDSFFDLGGHSLLVLKALFEIERAFDVALKVADFYQCPTIGALSARLSNTAAQVEVVDAAREATLADSIAALPDSPRHPARAILLTGATGFVGRFLLWQLLESTNATIYCHVRAGSEHEASFRLRATLGMWDLWREGLESRLVAVPGDLRLPRLGIDEAAYRTICRDVDSIFHCGSSMNHLETYAMAKPANVDAARELLKIAASGSPKLINHISTLGIFNPLAFESPRVVDEESAIGPEKQLHSHGYVASKWVAEQIFMAADARGIPCNIFRLGIVWADSRLGRYDESQRIYRILKSCLLSGLGIDDYQRYELPPIPVDCASRAVAYLAERHRRGGRVFHISGAKNAGNGRLDGGLFERVNVIAGTDLELMSFYDWTRAMKRLHQSGHSLPAVPLIEYAFAMEEQAFDALHKRFSDSLRIDCDRTHAELQRGGIVAPAVDDDMLGACLESMMSRDAELRDWACKKGIVARAATGPHWLRSVARS